jgi:hypothetical protein
LQEVERQRDEDMRRVREGSEPSSGVKSFPHFDSRGVKKLLGEENLPFRTTHTESIVERTSFSTTKLSSELALASQLYFRPPVPRLSKVVVKRTGEQQNHPNKSIF